MSVHLPVPPSLPHINAKMTVLAVRNFSLLLFFQVEDLERYVYRILPDNKRGHKVIEGNMTQHGCDNPPRREFLSHAQVNQAARILHTQLFYSLPALQSLISFLHILPIMNQPKNTLQTDGRTDKQTHPLIEL